MPYDPSRHRRRSIRRPDYDYATPGWYFVTICTRHRACLLGAVEGDAVRLTPAGQMAEAWWHRLPSRFPSVRLDAFIVMPNHIHGVIGLTGRADATFMPAVPGPAAPAPAVGAPLVGALRKAEQPIPRAGTRPAPADSGGAATGLGHVVGAFKSLTTNAYICGVRTQGWPPFDRRVWQRNYYERILRSEREIAIVRRYVAENPLRWNLDRLHPALRRRSS